MSESIFPEPNDLPTYLRERILEEEARTRTVWRLGGAVVALLVVAISVVTHIFCYQMMDPEQAGPWAAVLFQERFPNTLTAAETRMIAQAPEVAAMAVDGLVALPALVGHEGRSYIDRVADEALPALHAELTASLQALLREHEQDARALYAEHDDEARVRDFVDTLAADVVASLDLELRKESGQGLDYLLYKSLVGLQEMEAQLTHLNRTPDADLSREDRLHKRLMLMILRRIEAMSMEIRRENDGALIVLP